MKFFRSTDSAEKVARPFHFFRAGVSPKSMSSNNFRGLGDVENRW
jgi:hypothetical protein